MRSLKQYQVEGREFVKTRPGAGLFMDMGLGKTPTTLFALRDLILSGEGPVIVVGPIRVVESVWKQEAELWPELAGLSFSLLRGTPKERKAAAATKADVYLVNPELLQEALALLPHAKILVVDESSMFKNPSTMRFKNLRRSLKRFTRRIILTGTPTPNSLLDLWSQVFILDFGQRLGTSFYAYRERFFEKADYMGYNWRVRPGAEEEILKLVSDIILRIDAATYLPPRSVLNNQVFFDLPPAAAKLYKSMEKDALAVIGDKTIVAATAVAALMKLRQIASGFLYDDEAGTQSVHEEKLKALDEILEETGSPVIVVYQFIEELAMLKKRYKHGVVFDSPVIPRWNAGKIPLMFLHPQSGGHGVNLQHGGHTMAIFSGSFSQEQMAQTYARIDRQGQEHPVVFHHLTARNTVDELIFQVLQEKTQNQNSLLERIKTYAKARSNRRA